MGTKLIKEKNVMTTETKTIEKIRASYTQNKPTKLDELKKLDKKVKRPVQIFAYLFGSLSSLVLGAGMSLAMKVIGDSMMLGIGVGLLGILLVSINYPLYKTILKSRKNKYSNQIVEMTDSLLNK